MPADRSRPTAGDEESLAVALAAAHAADDKLAVDVIGLDVHEVLGICDWFVLASARNERQVKSVVDEVEAAVRERTGRSPRSVEGLQARRWVLLDYGDVVVHVFHTDERSWYRLERLYGDVPRLDWEPAGRAVDAAVDDTG